MKNINSIIAKLLFSTLILVGFSSCNEDTYEDYNQTIDTRPALAMSGEWFIDLSIDGNVIAEHVRHKTYDSNDGKLFIDDDQNGYYIKGKMNYDLNSLTFNTTEEPNLIDSGTFNVTEGKIIKNGAVTEAGNVVDSIYFKATFSYDPETVVTFSGHRRSGFLEDE